MFANILLQKALEYNSMMLANSSFVSVAAMCVLFTLCAALPNRSRRSIQDQLSTAKTRSTATCFVTKFNFTAEIADDEGKKCRQTVRINACDGGCETIEVNL